MARTTLKEKITEAYRFADNIRALANTLRKEAKSYDAEWPLEIANTMDSKAKELMKILFGK